jgi:hypothetical protein
MQYRRLFQWIKQNIKPFKLGLGLVALLLFPYRLTRSCGIDNYGFSGYSFLNPNIVNEEIPSFHAFMRFDDVYRKAYSKKDSAYQERLKDENLWEWKHKFCDYADLADIRYVVYQAPIDELIEIQVATRSDNIKLDSRLAENEFAEQLRSNKCSEVIDYLIFAKKCEPHVYHADPWVEKPRDLGAMRQLINNGKIFFTQTKSHFIKLRYAFQVMRLAHYSGNYQETIQLYDFFLPKIDRRVQSVVHYWVLSLKAGALKRLGQYAESAYLFSIVFQGCISKKDAALQSFEIQTDAQFNQALTLCKNDKEKASLYTMRGYADDAKAVEEMQLIYDLDPNNENLETLLLREIRKAERDLLGLTFNDRRARNQRLFNIPRQGAGEYAIRLNQFIVKCIKENRVKNHELWLVADGYMTLIRGDYYAAQQIFDRIKDNLSSEALREQVEILELIAQIHGFEQIDAATEEKAAAIINNDLYKKYEDLPDFLFDKLADLYQKAGMKGRAFRSHHDLDALKPNPQMDIINDLLALAQKTGKNALERALVSDRNGKDLIDELWELKGVALMAENQYEAALECFKNVSNERLEKSKFTPFEARIKDCIHCPLKDSTKALNRREIAERIIDLQYQSRADIENSAIYLYRLGIAHYNMSYYGHAWGAKDFYRSGTSWVSAERLYSDTYTTHYYPFGNREYTDMKVALAYFEAALDLAQGRANDRELAARCAFWAARCQQKQYFDGKDFRQMAYGFIPQLPSAYLTYMQRLAKMSDTEYYQNVLKECGYFAKYVKD